MFSADIATAVITGTWLAIAIALGVLLEQARAGMKTDTGRSSARWPKTAGDWKR